MKRRLNVRTDSELQMHQGSLVELTEQINETLPYRPDVCLIADFSTD